MNNWRQTASKQALKICGPFRDKRRRHPAKQWYLSYFVPKKDAAGAVVMRDGRAVLERKRPYYETRVLAEEDKPRLAAQYAAAGASTGGVLSRDLVAELEEAKKLVPEARLPDVARFWRSHHPLGNVKRVRDLAPLYLAAVELRVGRTRHFEDLKSRVGTIFVRHFGDRIPETLTQREGLAWLTSFPGRAKSGRTVLNLKQAACGFFNWLKEEGHSTHNPFGGIKRRRLPKITSKEIGFLGLEAAEAYLRACERYDPELVAHEIVQLLAGVRADDEMKNFRGEWVLPQTREVVIPAAFAKTGKREVIGELEAAFWAWWKVYGRAGLLRPYNGRRRWLRVRVLARLPDGEEKNELARLTPRALAGTVAAKAAAAAWPWNARRRTFVTFHVAKHQSADKTALIIRHRGDTYTLHNSYRGLGVTQRLGVKFFELRPQPVKRPEPPPASTRPERKVVRLQSERAKVASSEKIA